jgi:MOSC domain-containing protein YiiM
MSAVASVLSVQTGKVAFLGHSGVPSGFVKRAVQGAVKVKELGIEGDEQADLGVHGGPEKAVYFYSSEHHVLWGDAYPEHAAELHPGSFGENLTTAGLHEGNVAIGDVYRIGTALFQVTQPRLPCFKLGIRFKDNRLGRTMIRTGRTGWYARVVSPGEVQAGDAVYLVEKPNPEWTIARFTQVMVRGKASIEDLIELAGLSGLPQAWRELAARSVNALAQRLETA